MEVVERSRSGVRVAQASLPGKPGRGQLAIHVEAASLNRADYGKAASSRWEVVGSDVAGTVCAVGEGVGDFAVGDRVCAVTKGLRGGLAEVALADARWAARMPESMGYACGAALPSAGVTALAAVRKAGLCKGSRVLVCGASGGVGQYVTAFATAAGADVTAACGGPNADVARAAGARRAFDYSGGLEALDAGSFDVVIAVNGSFPTREYARVLAPGGTDVLVGADSLRPSVLTLPLRGRRLRVATFFSLIGKEGMRQAVDAVTGCGFRPSIETLQGLEGAARALTELEGGGHPKGKMVAVL